MTLYACGTSVEPGWLMVIDTFLDDGLDDWTKLSRDMDIFDILTRSLLLFTSLARSFLVCLLLSLLV